MRRVAVVLSLLCFGCMEEQVGPGAPTPITRTGPPPPPTGGPPAIKPPPPPAAAPAPPPPDVEPSEPAGVGRAKLGDLVEFSWSRVSEPKPDAIQAKAMLAAVAAGHSPDAKAPPPALKPTIRTGTVTVVRVEPEKPFTFRVEIKSGKDSEQKLYRYGPDIALYKVLYRTEAEDPKKKAKAAGTVFDCVQSGNRLVAAASAPLALSGGLVTETSPDPRMGAVSVALTRVGKSGAAASAGPARIVDTFEPPIAIAMQQIEKFAMPDPNAQADQEVSLQKQVATLANPCAASLKPPRGLLGVTLNAGKLVMLSWQQKPAPKALDKCVRLKLKKLKLPAEPAVFTVNLGTAAD